MKPESSKLFFAIYFLLTIIVMFTQPQFADVNFSEILGFTIVITMALWSISYIIGFSVNKIRGFLLLRRYRRKL
jgi:hypothetical protein